MRFRHESFEERGFFVVDDVLDADRIAAIGAAIEARAESPAVRARQGERYAVRNALTVLPHLASIALESAALQATVALALGHGAFAVRATLFDKTPAANWHVPWHQDRMVPVRERHDVAGFGPWSTKAGVCFVQPPAQVLESMVAVRLHLDDCGAENGPLRVIEGSHRAGFLDSASIDEWRRRSATTVTAARGSALVFRPLLLHASSPAANPSHRRVLHIEFATRPLPSPLQWIDPARIEVAA